MTLRDFEWFCAGIAGTIGFAALFVGDYRVLLGYGAIFALRRGLSLWLRTPSPKEEES